MLKGQAKKDYQREYMRGYMRERRLKMQVVKTPQLRPIEADRYEANDRAMGALKRLSVIASIDADGNPVYEE